MLMLKHLFLLTFNFHLKIVQEEKFIIRFVNSWFMSQEREEDQRTLILTWECLRLLGNTLVALSDLRLNLMSPVPRHLHVVRPFSHYATPVTLPGAVHHQIPLQVREHILAISFKSDF